jgi:hypothetical protein
MGSEATLAVRLISALHGKSPAADGTLRRVLCACTTRTEGGLGRKLTRSRAAFGLDFADSGRGAPVGGRTFAWDLRTVKSGRLR